MPDAARGTSRRRSMVLAALILCLLALGGFALGRQLAPVATQLAPTPSAPVPTVNFTPELGAAAAQTVGMTDSGCGDPLFGTGFAVARGYIATNAHLVAGTAIQTVTAPGGKLFTGTVVLFDPDLDVAVLRVPGLSLPGISPGAVSAGSPVAFSSFPGGNQRRISGALVSAVVTESQRDLYGVRQVQRQVMVLSARVHPGDSGSPVLTGGGHYAGMIFGYSATHTGSGFAITSEAMRHDIDSGVLRTRPTSTGRCLG